MGEGIDDMLMRCICYIESSRTTTYYYYLIIVICCDVAGASQACQTPTVYANSNGELNITALWSSLRYDSRESHDDRPECPVHFIFISNRSSRGSTDPLALSFSRRFTEHIYCIIATRMLYCL